MTLHLCTENIKYFIHVQWTPQVICCKAFDHDILVVGHGHFGPWHPPNIISYWCMRNKDNLGTMELVVVCKRWTHVQSNVHKKRATCQKIPYQNKLVAKGRGNKIGKVEDYKCKKWAWLGETTRRSAARGLHDGPAARVAKWHGNKKKTWCFHYIKKKFHSFFESALWGHDGGSWGAYEHTCIWQVRMDMVARLHGFISVWGWFYPGRRRTPVSKGHLS